MTIMIDMEDFFPSDFDCIRYLEIIHIGEN